MGRGCDALGCCFQRDSSTCVNDTQRTFKIRRGLLGGLDDALLLGEDDLDVRRWGCVALDTTVGLVDPPVAELLASVALDVRDDQVLLLHVRADARECVLDQLDEELAGLLRPAGGRAAPLLALGVMSNTLVVTEEWDSALVVNDSLKIRQGLLRSHTLDRTANFEHRLEVNAFHDSLSLQARNVFAERVGLTHLSKGWAKPTNR